MTAVNESRNLSKTLIKRVQQNCHLSDAQFAGNYSMCSFLLKMREYYRWENKLGLGERLSRDDIGDWLVKREKHWSRIADKQFQPIPLSRDIDPFDALTVNRELTSNGYVYSSGYGLFGKPHFFIGKLSDIRKYDEADVYISTQEFARDLVAPPAMSIGQNIFIRQESVRRYIWEKIEEWRVNKNKSGPMKNVLAKWNDLDKPDNLDTILDELVKTETEAMILHELGEIRVGNTLGSKWKELISEMSGTKPELYLRAVRDLLADCTVTLPVLLEENRTVSLHFYFANFTGLRKHLFPELRQAYDVWCDTKNSGEMNAMISSGIEKWQNIANLSLDYFKQKGNCSEDELESRILNLMPVVS